jgi:AcrR family transcriptional regulator
MNTVHHKSLAMNDKNLKDIETKLIEAATEIIKEDGLDKLSVRNISAKAKCSIGTLYNYFRDMNELILKVNAKTLLRLQETIAYAVSKTKSKQDLGKTLARGYLNFARNNTPYWNLLFKYKLPKGRTMPQWYRDIIDNNFRLLESALTPHIAKKHIHQATRTLWGACHGIISLSIDGKLDIASPETPESLCESLFENYLKGIK